MSVIPEEGRKKNKKKGLTALGGCEMRKTESLLCRRLSIEFCPVENL